VNKALLVPLIFLSTLLSAADGQFYINGHAAKDISISLGVSSINFGDVYNDSQVESVLVDFYVNAEDSYDYRVEISNDDSSGVLQMSRSSSTGYTGENITYINTANGSNQRHEFYVDLATEKMSDKLSATITVMALYNDIPE
jgi:hypothetical protein|tara:strand:- start:564 stop:989 length:426 start_codon:yes stop_codon:yes gene_type:complete